MRPCDVDRESRVLDLVVLTISGSEILFDAGGEAKTGLYMISEQTISEAVTEVLQEDAQSPSRIRHDVYEWSEGGRWKSRRTAPIPSVGNWSKDPPPSGSKREAFQQAVISDEDVPIVKSPQAAEKALKALVREVRIEATRDEPMRNESDYMKDLHSDRATGRVILPIVGVSFDNPFSLGDNLSVRPIENIEKELILNQRDLGGGSLGVTQSIQHGFLSHVLSFEVSLSPGEEWNGGLALLSQAGQSVHDKFENFKLAVRLLYSGRLQTSAEYHIDTTLYPDIFSAKEGARAATQVITEPETISDIEKLKNYYSLISNSDHDEGLRVALDRLDSAHKKVSNADNVVDIVIGIEALLSSGNGGSFREVRRRASVLAGKKSSYSELGRLQSLRNSTVHGDETQVDGNDVEQGRELLSVLIAKTLELQIANDLTREEILSKLDTAIESVIANNFEDLLSEFEN